MFAAVGPQGRLWWRVWPGKAMLSCRKRAVPGGVWSIPGGNSATATKATQDGNGKEISKTYLPLAGGTMEDDAEIKALNGRLDIATIVGTGTIYGTSIEGIFRNKVFEIDLTDTAIYD